VETSDRNAKRITAVFITLSTVVLLGATASSVDAAAATATPVELVHLVVAWVLGGFVAVALGAAVVYAAAGCALNARHRDTSLRRPPRSS
jgi:hypothetical protein